MNTDYARRMGDLFHSYGVLACPSETLPDHIETLAAQLAPLPIILPMPYLLYELLAEARCVPLNEVEIDSFERGLFTLEEYLPRFAAATLGEWELQDFRVGHAGAPDDYLHLIDFTFRGKLVHWEVSWSGGQELTELATAISAFADEHLTGQFIRCGNVNDGTWRKYYLPRPLIHDMSDLVDEASQSWPTADELVTLLRYRDDESAPDDLANYQAVWSNDCFAASVWGYMTTTLFGYSALAQLNTRSREGAAPLHTLVQATRQAQPAEWRRERLDMIAGLCAHGADPTLLDGAGRSAFDCAGADEAITQRLMTPDDDNIVHVLTNFLNWPFARYSTAPTEFTM